MAQKYWLTLQLQARDDHDALVSNLWTRVLVVIGENDDPKLYLGRLSDYAETHATALKAK